MLKFFLNLIIMGWSYQILLFHKTNFRQDKNSYFQWFYQSFSMVYCRKYKFLMQKNLFKQYLMIAFHWKKWKSCHQTKCLKFVKQKIFAWKISAFLNFLTAILLCHSQLWAIVKGAVSLTRCYCILKTLTKMPLEGS